MAEMIPMGECEYDEKCKGAYYGSITFSTLSMDYDEYECSFCLCEEHYHQMIEPMRTMQKKRTDEWVTEIERRREINSNSGAYPLSELMNLLLFQKTVTTACEILNEISESFDKQTDKKHETDLNLDSDET